jgi:hypothetical protein
LPRDSYKRAADADLKFLQERLAELAKKQADGEKILAGRAKPALGVALMLSVYADALGDEALRTGSLGAAGAIEKKDFKAASALAQKLVVKPGTAGKVRDVPKPFKDELVLAATQSVFRGSRVGGLNIDRDIQDMTKVNNPKPIDPAAVELLAVRSAVISEFAFHSPDDRAKAKATETKLWEKWSRESTKVSQQLADEAAKGEKADVQKLRKLLTTLNARCTDCHSRPGAVDDR